MGWRSTSEAWSSSGRSRWSRGASLWPRWREGSASPGVRQFIDRVPADVLVEVTTLDPRTGQPATAHVRQALARGMHVVTANKGPVAFAHASLGRLAARKNRLFLHEGAVMDGTPVFNLAERCLRGALIVGFRGTLNSTTNLVLSRMEEGLSLDRAVREAQGLGIAEADPRNDLEGWDAAVKACALANALMGASVRPAQVRRRGILAVTASDVRRALRSGSANPAGGARREDAPSRARSRRAGADPAGRSVVGIGAGCGARAPDRPHGGDRRLRAGSGRRPDRLRAAVGSARGRPLGAGALAALSELPAVAVRRGSSGRRLRGRPRSARSAASQRSFLSTRTAIVPSRIVSVIVETFSKLASDGATPRQARTHCSSSSAGRGRSDARAGNAPCSPSESGAGCGR